MRAEMPVAGAAVATQPARNVTLCRYAVADFVVVHTVTDLCDVTDELMTDHERRSNRALRPVIPVVYVQVGAADGGLVDLDQHLVGTYLGDGYLLHPDPGLRRAFDQRLHRAHGITFGPAVQRFP